MSILAGRPAPTTADGAAMTTSRGRRVLAAVADDLRAARSQLLYSTVGGSALLPGAGRRLLFAFAGAHVRSAPGTGFRFSGRPSNLTVGADVYMNQGVFIEAHAPVVIGDGCLLGMDAMIVTNNHPVDPAGRISPQGEAVAVAGG